MKAIAEYLRDFGESNGCKDILFADVPDQVQPEDPVRLYTDPTNIDIQDIKDVGDMSYAFTISAKALAAFAVGFIATGMETSQPQQMPNDKSEVMNMFERLLEFKRNGRNEEIGFVITQYLIEAISWDRLMKRTTNPLKNPHVVMGCTLAMWFIGSVPESNVKKLIEALFH